MDQLLMNLRLKNVFRVEDVAYAILEANGQVSVLPKADKRPLQPHDLNLPVSAESLPFEETLSELRAYLRHWEQTDALATLYRLETLWHNIAKF